MKGFTISKNYWLLLIAAVCALAAVIIYTVQAASEQTLFFPTPLMLVLGILFSAFYYKKKSFIPLVASLCYSAAMGLYLFSMLTNVINTYVHMANYNLIVFYLLIALMSVCCISSIVCCFLCDGQQTDNG